MILIIGLGGIGGGMGWRLSSQGLEVAGLDLDRRIGDRWAQESGCQVFESPGDVPWARTDHVVIAVRTPEQVDQVFQMLGDEALERELSVFVVSTLAVSHAALIAEGRAPGWRVFELPVSGGEGPARDGTLTMFAAGPARTDNEAQILAHLANQVFDFDSFGQPALAKLLNNVLAAHNASGFAELLSLASSQGIPNDMFSDVIANSSGQSFLADNFGRISENQIDLLAKDIELLRSDFPAFGLFDGPRTFSATVSEMRMAVQKLESAI